ncbi:DUF3396 domain-containing protein [Corallococcus sp. CA053C]|uniref:DUF3396 domain-containing protein n=1 Tax=Corallococcus sp. CA053C TaxID=2316732 RepID=UPI000EA27691|nr:DUF3396 domain-containing protein [Corallococcus sp. CA053C]
MSNSIPRIRLHVANGEILVAREGLQICFYMPHPHAALKEGVQRALDVYLETIGGDALGSYSDLDGQWQQLDSKGWDVTRRSLHDEAWAYIHLTEAAQMDDRFDFHYVGKPLGDPDGFYGPEEVSALAVSLPTEFLETHGPGRVHELALDMAKSLPFSSGHAGLAFLGEPLASSVFHEVEKLALRHPAMDVLSLDGRSRGIGTRVTGPAWMTFLGPPVLPELGGAAVLRTRLQSPDTTVQELGPDRAVVTLGPWPEAGDTEQGQTLPAYRELARVLEPWLYQEHPGPPQPNEHALQRIRRRLERRFLD